MIRRFGRVAATLAVLPALVFSPLTARAILIHDHHGHDTHTHTLTIHDLDAHRPSREHPHEHRHHDRPAVDPTEDEGSAVLILLDLPKSLVRGRVLSNGPCVVASSQAAPLAPFVAVAAPPSICLCIEHSSRLAHPARAHDSLEAILRTSHALLL